MWTCKNCGRIFKKEQQPHSCNTLPLEKHFENKEKSKRLFDHLLDKINKTVGKCKVISLPCCIHLYGNYDFLAALPKKDRLEIRMGLDRALKSSRFKQSVSTSQKTYKNCIDVISEKDIDDELVGWIRESYYLK